jgi:hypothetical protein
MTAATGMSQSAVSQIWRAFGLKPRMVQTWKLGTDLRLACALGQRISDNKILAIFFQKSC